MYDALRNNRLVDNNDNTICLASTLKLYRNLGKYPFPGKLESDKRKQVLSLFEGVILKNSLLKKPVFLNAAELDSASKEFLAEHFLTTEGFQRASTGEGFFIDDSGEFFAIINVINHLQLMLTICGGELEKARNRLVKIETEMGKSIDFAFSQKFGFLASNPEQCGTGFVIDVFLHLPAMIHSGELERFIENNDMKGIALGDIQGNISGTFVGDVVTVHNTHTLGLTEANIIQNVQGIVTKLVVEEQGMRGKLRNDENLDMKDMVSKAYGILKYAYQLQTVEAFNSLSIIKLGVDLGWVENIDQRKINSVFLNNRRAHLVHTYGRDIDKEDLSGKRAEYIKHELESVTLTI